MDILQIASATAQDPARRAQAAAPAPDAEREDFPALLDAATEVPADDLEADGGMPEEAPDTPETPDIEALLEEITGLAADAQEQFDAAVTDADRTAVMEEFVTALRDRLEAVPGLSEADLARILPEAQPDGVVPAAMMPTASLPTTETPAEAAAPTPSAGPSALMAGVLEAVRTVTPAEVAVAPVTDDPVAPATPVSSLSAVLAEPSPEFPAAPTRQDRPVPTQAEKAPGPAAPAAPPAAEGVPDVAPETETVDLAPAKPVDKPAPAMAQSAPTAEPARPMPTLPQPVAPTGAGEAAEARASLDPVLPTRAAAAEAAPAFAFARSVAAQMRGHRFEEGTTRVELTPRGLGDIEVEVARDESGKLRIVLRAENPAVVTAFRNDRDLIASVLRDGGVAVDEGELGFEQFGGHENGQRDDRPAPPARFEPQVALAETQLSALGRAPAIAPSSGLNIVA